MRYFDSKNDGSALWLALEKLGKNIATARLAALTLARAQGADNYVAVQPELAGGIEAFHFRVRPAKYHPVFETTLADAYFPDDIPANGHLLDDIRNLPVVKYKDLVKMIGYAVQWDELTEARVSVTDVIVIKKNVIALALAEVKTPYRAIGNLREITEAEYEAIKALPA